ncbi:Alginate lyase [Maioricimonas rarisocia]|uniref:Alginate lyase n=1 Tax=Maioricimonas rarisocia TaxID=2528026 RepID=A0A517Z025_9PLAN|nr:alginate lyase family protein [Maioricimonas rarisocia]QDU35848.1 Alginate lyase [Maioricimonas rarisocia]
MPVTMLQQIAVCTLLLVSSLQAAHAEFTHPGIAHTQASIDFVKEKIATGEEPWASAWRSVQNSRYADLDWTPRPHAHVERGPSNRPDIGSSEFTADANAAYVHALCWTLTGDEAHARKAAEILNAWSGTLETISNHDARLLVGMDGYDFCNAAELLRHTWDGWPEADQARFETMLREIFYPIIRDFYPSANGNWDAAMLQTMLAMGVYLDDQAMFDRGLAYYLDGEGNGAVRNYFKPSGQCQESGRDQAHTQMGLGFLACTCEVAWNQGVDLYGAYDNLLLKGYEYTAKYNLGYDVPYEPYRSFEGRYHYKTISDDSRGRLQAIYEKVLNHYANRRGLEAPFTRQAAQELREDSNDRRSRGRRSRRRGSSALETLMYFGQPADLVMPAGKTDVGTTRPPALELESCVQLPSR